MSKHLRLTFELINGIDKFMLVYVALSHFLDSYKPIVIGSVGIGVRKSDQELLRKINASLARLKADGTVGRILEKWGLKAPGA